MNVVTGAIYRGDPRCRKMTAAIYCRKSTATEGRSKSRDEQLEICERDAEDIGFGEVLVFMEEEGQKGDWSWKDGAGRNAGPFRPELTRLVQMIESGQIQAVICYKTDRLVRSTEVMVALRKVFQLHGVRLVAQGRDCELDTARGKYQNTVDSANAEQWRDQISEDIKRDHDYKARTGFFSRNPSCLGFRSKGRGSQAVEPQWTELKLVNRIFTMFAVGEDKRGPLGISAICKVLMDDGISLCVGAKGHKSKNPKRIYTSQVKTILANVMYAGRWRHNGQEHTCDRLLIVDPATQERRTAVPIALFEVAQARLRSMPAQGKRSMYSDHLLSGIAICGCCGRPLHINNRRRKDGSLRKTFICSRKRDTLSCTREGMANISEDQLDAWTIKYLAPWVAAEMEALREAAHDTAECDAIADLQRQLTAAKLKETDQLASVLGVLDEHQIGQLASKLRAERESIERRLRELSDLIRTDQPYPRLQLELNALDPVAAKTAIRSAIRWIAVTAEGVVVLTSWGTYIGGRLVAARPTNWNAGEPRRSIAEPDLVSCVQCLSWIPDPERFVLGRRFVLGKQSGLFSDEDLLPVETLLQGKEDICA